MRIPQLAQYLIRLYKAGEADGGRVSILLLGDPGIGKSYTVRQVAEHMSHYLKKDFIDYDDDAAPKILADPEKFFVFCDFRLTECEPSDLLGVPREVDGGVKFAPLLWARCLSKSAGILLLDELTNVQRPDVITAAYKLILDRKAGFTKFHNDVMIIACGNKPEHSSVASKLPTPLINRMLTVELESPTVNEWGQFMSETYGDEWDKRVLIFLTRFENEGYLIKVPKDPETLDAYPTPRSWTKVARLMYKGFVDDDTICGLIGAEVGQKLKAFLRTNVEFEKLLDQPEEFSTLSIDAKYMVCLMLANWLTKNDCKKALPLIDVMSSDSREYLVLTASIMPKNKLVAFFDRLFKYNPKYREVLSEIVALIREIS